ncbi:MAG: hypothetical protein H0W74_07590 [Sphingosinicella sp.]|nr:hypothetical protein [Sphingosinicella sp.]
MGEDAVTEIEAEQVLLARSIKEAKQLSARSDVLMDAARAEKPKPQDRITTA